MTASSLLLANALRTQHHGNEQIRKHLENVLTLRHAEALIVDAETGQRGFIVTADPVYLGPYSAAKSELPAELQKLIRDGVDQPGDGLERLSLAKMRELDRTVQLARAGKTSMAVAIIGSGTGKRYMDSIRAEVSRLVAEQQRQIGAAIQGSEKTTIDTYAALALLVVSSFVIIGFGLILLLRTQRLEQETMRLRQVEQAERQTALVARELNHRVKNLFSVILAIVQLASRGSTTPRESVRRITERIEALARAHEVSLGKNPMVGFDLEAMLRAILGPYVSATAGLKLSGPTIQLPVMRATPIGLIVHELATNAIKHGAWSRDGGNITVNWSNLDVDRRNGTPAGHMLRFHWQENRSKPLESEQMDGFGSKLIKAAVAQLGGSITTRRDEHGYSIVIDAPIIPAYPESERSNQQEAHDD